MGSRREGREMALQVLYLSDTCSLEPEEALKSAVNDQIPRPVQVFCAHLVAGVHEQRGAIDKILAQYAQNWDLKRMAVIDRNILRLSTYEILNDLDTPLSVIIDEAIEIAKTYSTEDSGKFVNGILDKIKAERKAA